MSAEIQHPETSLAESYLKYYGVNITFSGEIPTIISGETNMQSDMWHVVFELISNCVHNRMPESSEGAKDIQVTFESGKLTVEDDFICPNPEQDLQKILKIRDSKKPITTKEPEDGLPAGGAGIYTSIRKLEKYGGRLDYTIKDKKIVAIATWEEDHL